MRRHIRHGGVYLRGWVGDAVVGSTATGPWAPATTPLRSTAGSFVQSACRFAAFRIKGPSVPSTSSLPPGPPATGPVERDFDLPDEVDCPVPGNQFQGASPQQQRVVLNRDMFTSALLCPKKAYFAQNMTKQDLPTLSIGERVRLDDGISFAEFCRELSFIDVPPDQRFRVKERDWENALVETDVVLTSVFNCTDRAAKFVVHRACFSFTTDSTQSTDGGLPFNVELRARIPILVINLAERTVEIQECRAVTRVTKDGADVLQKELVYHLLVVELALQKFLKKINSDLSFKCRVVLKILSHTAIGPLVIGTTYYRNMKMAIQNLTLEDLALTAAGSANPKSFQKTPLAAKVPPYNIQRCKQDLRQVVEVVYRAATIPLSWSMHFGSAKRSFPTTDCSALPPSPPAPQAPPSGSETALVNQTTVAPLQMEFLIGSHCKAHTPCPYHARGYCLPSVEKDSKTIIQQRDNSIFSIPLLRTGTKRDLVDRNILSVSQFFNQATTSDSVAANELQLRYCQAVTTGMPLLNLAYFSEWFHALQYPVFFLDFEGSQFALPPFTGVRPYAPVAFQYSLHVFQHDVLTETPTHYEYLHLGKDSNAAEDPRMHLMQSLMDAVAIERSKKRLALFPHSDDPLPAQQKKNVCELGSVASILSSSAAAKAIVNPWDGCFISHNVSYEKMCLANMRLLNAAWEKPVENFIFMDTLKLCRSAVLHPGAFGSFSIKALLPALCPTVSYASLDATALSSSASDGETEEAEAKGDNAAALYREWQMTYGYAQKNANNPLLHRGKTPEEAEAFKAQEQKKWQDARASLLLYCKTDTWGMVEILRSLYKLATERKLVPSASKGWSYATDDVLPNPTDLPAPPSSSDISDLALAVAAAKGKPDGTKSADRKRPSSSNSSTVLTGDDKKASKPKK